MGEIKDLSELSDARIEEVIAEISAERDRLLELAHTMQEERDRRLGVAKAKAVIKAIGTEGVKHLMQHVEIETLKAEHR